MSGFSESASSAQDGGQQSTFDASHYQPPVDQQQLAQQQQPTPSTPGNDTNSNGKGKQRRSSPIPRKHAQHAMQARRGAARYFPASIPQSCLKRGLGGSCQYPDPESDSSAQPSTASAPVPPQASFMSQIPVHTGPYYYDYSASTTTLRSAKRPRPLTEDEAAAITRNFQRGDFYVGTSGPVRIDPRLPVRLTLGEGDHVHFTISEAMM
ncbi:hypothetical protein EW145_g6758 [Phellinidium pouzarii]|uniref:Uncharacterized protein n=1 Tax=Phellinidium pouzarii TaxID=167371 RepID=A0A4S4KUN0_9AGAM|nr:hypothetical protein EW145_g6758 [Phellinidium pouzarii]